LCRKIHFQICYSFFKGNVFLYPTYGRVSRYGLIQSASSMDQIGILADIEDAFKLLEIISGYDNRDGMSMQNSEFCISEKARKLKITKFTERDQNISAVYSILSAAEFTNNISRYDGVKFGYRAKNFKNFNEMYIKSRTESFSADVKLKAILGNIVLSKNYYQKYYDKAMRYRGLVKSKLESLLKNCDILEITEPESGHFALSPLTGLPSLTFIKNGIKTIALAKQTDEDALYIYGKEVKI